LERTEHAERNAEIQQRVKAEFRPALDAGELFHRLHGPLDRGDIDLLQAMVIQSEYRGAVWPAYPSPGVEGTRKDSCADR
jgi:hypothetical protein